MHGEGHLTMSRHVNYRGPVDRPTLLTMRAEFAARAERLRGELAEFVEDVAELDRRLAALDQLPPAA